MHAEAARLEVATTTAGKATTIAVSGDLDLHTVGALRAELDRAFDGGALDLTVDARGVQFVDSSGLGALVGARKSAIALDVELRVLPSPRMRSVLERTGLARFLGATS
jgi:anti-sigma B factor antagonist